MMICSRRLYKGNAYDICLPLADSGVTLARFYTRGDVILEKEPEISGDSMCFSFAEEDLASLEDGVLRYQVVTDYETTDTNSPYVVVTPGDYSGSTLEDLLEDAYDSGYTDGQEDCTGGTCEGVYESGYTDGYQSGYTDGQDTCEECDCTTAYTSGYTDGYESGNTDGYQTGYDDGYNAGSESCSGEYERGYDDGYQSGYTSGYTDGSESCVDTAIALIQRSPVSYEIPEGTTSIGDGAFYRFTNLTAVTIPSTVLTIGEESFRHCSNLKSITIPDGVTTIGSDAIADCHSLTSITISSSVTSIGDYAFVCLYDYGIEYMELLGTVPPTIGYDSLGASDYDTFPIYVPDESVQAYKTAYAEFGYADRIKGISEKP